MLRRGQLLSIHIHIHNESECCVLLYDLLKLVQSQTYLQLRNRGTLGLAHSVGPNPEVCSECKASEKSSRETVIQKKPPFSILKIQMCLIGLKQQNLEK